MTAVRLTSHYLIFIGWRGIDEQKRVCFGNFQLGVDDEGVEFVELHVERGTKTRSGCEGQQECAFNSIMHALSGYHCPVDLFKKYKSVRPAHTKLPHSPFYLQPARDLSNIINPQCACTRGSQ